MNYLKSDKVDYSKSDKERLDRNVRDRSSSCTCHKIECICPCLYGAIDLIEGIVPNYCLEICDDHGKDCDPIIRI